MKPLIDKEYLLKKIPGKGGWTYAEVPEVLKDPHSPFGWVKVKGSIDGVKFANYRMMPLGNGNLFLPVKAEIRKKIGKEAGDTVHVILFADHDPPAIPVALKACLRDSPPALSRFQTLSEGEQKAFINWIESAKTDATRAKRIAQTIDKVLRGESFYQKPEQC